MTIPLFVINDLHVGALRSGGTTTASAAELRKQLLAGFASLMEMADGDDVLINGDLFDTASIPLIDLFAALDIGARWLARNPANMLFLPAGNHDLSKNSEVFSSFDLFAQYLRVLAPERVVVIRQATQIRPTMWVVPHMQNQDLFELELSKIPECTYLFVHCNYDNTFATKSDHSLNISRAQAEKLPVERIVFGHEHQKKEALDGKVIVVGNQIPSSVADCLGNDQKFAIRVMPMVFKWIETWDSTWNFARLDWCDLVDSAEASIEFIRVEGTATAAQAAEVVQRIAKFRQKSSSLVITNAVTIEGHDTSEMDVSLEQIQSFNVMAELLNFLDEEQRVVVKALLEEHPNV